MSPPTYTREQIVALRTLRSRLRSAKYNWEIRQLLRNTGTATGLKLMQLVEWQDGQDGKKNLLHWLVEEGAEKPALMLLQEFWARSAPYQRQILRLLTIPHAYIDSPLLEGEMESGDYTVEELAQCRNCEQLVDMIARFRELYRGELSSSSSLSAEDQAEMDAAEEDEEELEEEGGGEAEEQAGTAGERRDERRGGRETATEQKREARKKALKKAEEEEEIRRARERRPREQEAREARQHPDVDMNMAMANANNSPPIPHPPISVPSPGGGGAAAEGHHQPTTPPPQLVDLTSSPPPAPGAPGAPDSPLWYSASSGFAQLAKDEPARGPPKGPEWEAEQVQRARESQLMPISSPPPPPTGARGGGSLMRGGGAPRFRYSVSPHLWNLAVDFGGRSYLRNGEWIEEKNK
ncbi:hypothetical protein B0T20DRAFT_496119 [Sordaria brevicollis]|uniref:Uncharacterized protein n=1 Tax=Sordaria brevicollis TaxID=83679 RepID=A0AAE0UD96_SORBR|nr:hypothetical protein B0T20DRAFT_496119 [Sordaria brevicollis]